MPRKSKRLRAGKGVKASVLTRFVKPKQYLPNGDKGHRSEVIIDDKFEDDKGKDVYSFKYVGDDSEGMLLHASVRYVKIIEEGDVERLFDDEGGGEGGKIKWRDSEARRLLCKDVREGVIGDAMALKDVYAQRPQFAAYDYEKFSSRLATIKNAVKKLDTRAEEDEQAFQKYVGNHPVSLYDRNGYIQWQGSKSQKLAKQDVEAGLLKQGYRVLFLSRPEYYEEFDFKVWSDKIRQEIKTKKYLHTLKVTGKYHKAS